MTCGIIKQCKAITKHKCQCKNHVTNDGDFCERHSKKEATNSTTVAPVNTQEYTIPENIFVNGKFIPNINKVKVPVFNKNPNIVIKF
jgi:hypothetical protein